MTICYITHDVLENAMLSSYNFQPLLYLVHNRYNYEVSLHFICKLFLLHLLPPTLLSALYVAVRMSYCQK